MPPSDSEMDRNIPKYALAPHPYSRRGTNVHTMISMLPKYTHYVEYTVWPMILTCVFFMKRAKTVVVVPLPAIACRAPAFLCLHSLAVSSLDEGSVHVVRVEVGCQTFNDVMADKRPEQVGVTGRAAWVDSLGGGGCYLYELLQPLYQYGVLDI